MNFLICLLETLFENQSGYMDSLDQQNNSTHL